MSCNYYIETKDVEMAFDLGERVNILWKSRMFECHLCQTCGDLKPLFESHSYKTFEELKNILLNESYEYRIVNEYGMEISTKDFISYMERDNARGKVRYEMPIDKDGWQFLNKDFC